MSEKERAIVPELQPERFIRISDLPENSAELIIVDGNPPVRLQLSGLRSVVPQKLQDQIAVNVDVLAGFLRMGGMKGIRFDVQEGEQEQFGMQLAGVSGDAGVAGRVGATKVTIEPTLDELDRREEILLTHRLSTDHGDIYRSGGITLEKADLQEDVKRRANNNPTDAMGWIQTLNKKTIQDVSKLSRQHLKSISPKDFSDLIIREGMVQLVAGLMLWAASVELKTPPPIGIEVIVAEIVSHGFVGLTSDVLDKYVLRRRELRSRRIGEFGENGPEYVRSLVMKAISDIPVLRKEFPIFIFAEPRVKQEE